jgi:hypothetical protein
LGQPFDAKNSLEALALRKLMRRSVWEWRSSPCQWSWFIASYDSCTGYDAADAYRFLAARDVLAPAGTFYAYEPFRALNLEVDAGLRVGLAPYNDDSEIDRLLSAFEEFMHSHWSRLVIEGSRRANRCSSNALRLPLDAPQGWQSETSLLDHGTGKPVG